MRKLWQSRFSFVVFIAHLLLLAYFVSQRPLVSLTPPPKAVSVKTVQLKKPKPKPKPPVPKAQPQSPKKEVAKKKSPKPKQSNKPSPKKSEPKPVSAEKTAALKKARESLAKIERLPHKSQDVPVESVATVPELRSEKRTREQSQEQSSYRDELVRRLRLLLRLPDYGAVQVEVTLSKSGQVQHIEILSSASRLNRAYVESTLPTVRFASFSGELAGLKEKTFLLTLENDGL